ncbi:MAG: PilZ domain-containing protein [Methylococcales bacterium]|nr:PilZ domain-containing protein [Methylococcales bacterium]
MSHKNRDYLSQYLKMTDQYTNEQLGYLADLSKGGMMFVTNQQIPINKVLDVCIEFNELEEGTSKTPIQAQIKTIWTKPNINPKMFCIGCKVVKIDSSDEQKLEMIGNSLGFDDDVEIKRVRN